MHAGRLKYSPVSEERKAREEGGLGSSFLRKENEKQQEEGWRAWGRGSQGWKKEKRRVWSGERGEGREGERKEKKIVFLDITNDLEQYSNWVWAVLSVKLKLPCSHLLNLRGHGLGWMHAWASYIHFSQSNLHLFDSVYLGWHKYFPSPLKERKQMKQK